MVLPPVRWQRQHARKRATEMDRIRMVLLVRIDGIWIRIARKRNRVPGCGSTGREPTGSTKKVPHLQSTISIVLCARIAHTQTLGQCKLSHVNAQATKKHVASHTVPVYDAEQQRASQALVDAY